MADKRVVLYTPHERDEIVVGKRGLIINPPFGHTSPLVSGTCAVYTSLVVKINETGFETENSRYEAYHPSGNEEKW